MPDGTHSGVRVYLNSANAPTGQPIAQVYPRADGHGRKRTVSSNCDSEHPDNRNKLSRFPRLFPQSSPPRARREGTVPPLPPTERGAMARRVAASRISSVLSGVGRGQRAGVAVRSTATIPARTSGGRLAHPTHAATRRARSASGGAWPPRRPPTTWAELRPASGRPFDRVLRLVSPPGAARAAHGAARPSESAYSLGDSASARGFNSPGLFSFPACQSPSGRAPA